MASLLRLCVPVSLTPQAALDLPPDAARHVQVRRLQPGDALRVFDGRGQEFEAQVLHMGRQSVSVQLGAPVQTTAEPARRVTLALGMPANERMDALVEKATELGVACIQPLMTERSVLRLDGARAQKRLAHWQGIAQAAAEQCGRATVPDIKPLAELSAWLAATAPAAFDARWLLSPAAPSTDALSSRALAPSASVCTLSGPEGGLSPAEEALSRRAGFFPVNLGPRVLRADTAPMALMAWLSLLP